MDQHEIVPPKGWASLGFGEVTRLMTPEAMLARVPELLVARTNIDLGGGLKHFSVWITTR